MSERAPSYHLDGCELLVQRWEHWACERGMAHAWIDANGWRRVPVHGVRWRSGNQAYTFVQEAAGR